MRRSCGIHEALTCYSRVTPPRVGVGVGGGVGVLGNHPYVSHCGGQRSPRRPAAPDAWMAADAAEFDGGC